MKTLQKPFFLLSLCTLLIISISCSKDDSNDDNLMIKAKSTSTLSQSRISSIAAVTISEFKINIKEIELEFDDDYNEIDTDGFIDSDDEIELEGPFELDLLSGTSNIASLEIPEANYEEIEFEFDKNTDESSEMFNKTVKIHGTIENIPFIFWHDFEEEIEVDFENEVNDITISANLIDIVINFNLDTILNQVDLTSALDGDNNGIIEISPEDPDGNNELADLIKEALKNATELLDD